MTTTDSSLVVKNAKSISILLTGATDYNINQLNFDRTIEPASKCKTILDNVSKKSVSSLYKTHVKEYQSAFHRVKLSLGNDNLTHLPTDKRLENVKNGQHDNGLIALYFSMVDICCWVLPENPAYCLPTCKVSGTKSLTLRGIPIFTPTSTCK